MMRLLVFVACAASCWALVPAGPIPPGVPEVRLVTSEGEAGIHDGPKAGLRVDPGHFDTVWSRGAVIVRGFPLEPGFDVDLELTSFDVVAPDARFVVVREGSEESLPPPAVRFFRGGVAGEPDSTAYLWMHDGFVGGFVRFAAGTARAEGLYVFGPRPDGLPAADRQSDRWISVSRARALPDGWSCETDRCSSAGERGWTPFPLETGGISDALMRAHVALDTTAKYRTRFRSDELATTYALTLLGAVSAIYERDLLCLLELSYFRLHVDDSPYSDDAFDPRTLLDELRLEWTTQPELQGIARSAVQLWHSPSALGGVAEIDALCDDALSYSVSYIQADHTDPLVGWSYDLYIVSHEFGHNFGSDHTHCYEPPIDHCGNWPGCYEGPIEQSPGTLMSYCDEPEYEFHSRVVDVIRPRIESAACIDVAGRPAAILGGPGQGLLLGQGPLLADLRNDDGEPDAVVGAPGEVRLAWLKRFASPCDDLDLSRVDVLIHDGSVQSGRPLQLLLFVDPSGTGQPGNATLVHSEARAVQVVSATTWNQYTLTSPLAVEAGDLYVGFHDLEDDPQTTFPASQDSSQSGDSYWAWDSIDPGEFTLQQGATWLVRAQGACDESTLLLDWSEPCNEASVPGQDFGVYQGTLEPPFDDHAALTCTTGRARSFMLPAMPAGNVYFVVVPSTGDGEGRYGSLAPAAAPCKVQEVGVCD